MEQSRSLQAVRTLNCPTRPSKNLEVGPRGSGGVQSARCFALTPMAATESASVRARGASLGR
eukprot:8519211-Alexandrium_andersonii.AAC.1